jgi:hypothetical protein
MHSDGYDALEVEQEMRDDDLLEERARLAREEFFSDLDDEDEPPRISRYGPVLPKAPREPVIGRLESFDREHVICEHELARALEALLTKEPVRLFNTDVEFEQFAQRVLDIAHDEKCPLKGA